MRPGVETPELPPGTTDPNQLVSVVAHFDDPASVDCKVEAPEAEEPEAPEEVELYCPTHLVVTAIELLGP